MYDPFLDLALEIWVLQRAGDPCSCFPGAGVSAGSEAVTCQATRALTSPPSLQQARDLREALELFVKPDLLGGENSYLCAGCV